MVEKKKSKKGKQTKTQKKKVTAKKKVPENEEKILGPEEIKAIEDKQLKWTLIVIGIVFLSVLIPYFAIQASKTFDFAGVEWQIQKDGSGPTGITWYATQFGKYYKGDYYGVHSVYLRNDPRKNKVLVEVGNLSFKKNWIYSFSPEVLEAKDQILGTMELGKITNALPFVEKVGVSSNNESFALENNLNYTLCDNKPRSTTFIEVKSGEQNRIYLQEKDCYVIEMERTEDFLLVAERFVIEIIRQINE